MRRGLYEREILAVAVAAAIFEIGLSRRKAIDGDAVGRAGDVIEADLMAEGHRGRFAPMFAADAEIDVRTDLE